MVERNPHFDRLSTNYLFVEIGKRRAAFEQQNPGVKLLHLGIGDTTLPIPACSAEAMASYAKGLSTPQGYSGYGPAAGDENLRKEISQVLYASRITADEVFISDGAKCDIGRLQALFGPSVSIAVQDPAYPVYVDGSTLQGCTKIVKTSFLPDFSHIKRADLIYFCSPNNPTGQVATREELEQLVHDAKQNQSIILFDSAYASYIQDPALPRSIYEIPGAEEVAIETSSFSKMAGFTGVRLGWTIVPKALRYRDGASVHTDWTRLVSTLFNGPCNIAQAGGRAILTSEGQKACKALVATYMQNAHALLRFFKSHGYTVTGGENAPYLWVHFPGRSSWDTFQDLLEEANIVSTPGSGFGPSGEGYVRFTAFASSATIKEAIKALESMFNYHF